MTHTKKQKRLDADSLLEFMKAYVTEPTREYRIHGMLKAHNYRFANFRNVVLKMRQSGEYRIVANKYGYYYTEDPNNILTYIVGRKQTNGGTRDYLSVMLKTAKSKTPLKTIVNFFYTNQSLYKLFV